MGIRVFQNTGNNLTEITDQCGLKNSEGWWNTIIAEDFDKDGDIGLCHSVIWVLIPG